MSAKVALALDIIRVFLALIFLPIAAILCIAVPAAIVTATVYGVLVFFGVVL